MSTNIYVIPDAHAAPGQDNVRFAALGAFLSGMLTRDLRYGRESKVVCLGDFADMKGLSFYDRGKLTGKAQNYQADVDAAHEAQDALFGAMSCSARRHADWHMCVGNHENRITRYVNDRPELAGSMGIEDLGYEKYGWSVTPFLEVLQLCGVHFSHYLPSGVMGKPIGGVNAARTLSLKCAVSCVVGHSHLLDFAQITTPLGQRINGLVAGCYLDHDEEYAGPVVNRAWWRGICILEDVQDGDYDLRTVRIDRILDLYRSM